MLATVEELRRYLNTTGGGASPAGEEQLLDGLLAAADARVRELLPDRTLAPDPAPVMNDDDPPVDVSLPVSRAFVLTGNVVQVPDLRRVHSITLDGVTYTGGYRLRQRAGQPAWWITFPFDYDGPVLTPASGSWRSTEYRAVERDLVVTGWWGPTEVAPHVKEAVLVWAARTFQERAARWSDARQDPDGGVASYFRNVPPSVKATIDSLKVPGL